MKEILKKGSLFFLTLFLVACGTSAEQVEPTIDVNALYTQAAETVIAGVNQTSTANAPTNTPVPTNTLAPTNTPVPPTPIPEPVVLTGTGDYVVDFDNPFEVAIVHIVGNASSRHFAVQTYSSNGERIDLLANTTDPYDGIKALDLSTDKKSTRFEVTATGEWRIEILSIASARILTVPGVIEGKGDEVLWVNGSVPDLAIIRGNAASSHFAVKVYGLNGYADLLVNTTDPYEGTTILNGAPLLIEVYAKDNWSIEMTAKE